MVGVVGVRLSPPHAGALGNGLGDVNARVLYGEVQNSCGASKEGGAGDLWGWSSRQVTVAHDGSGNVGVGLNAARHHDFACDVDYTSGLVAHGAGRSDRHDLFSLYRHVPVANSHWRYNLPAADDQIKHIDPLSCINYGHPAGLSWAAV